MDNKDEVINHLHIIHAFANMAYEDLHEQMFKYMSDWTKDAIELLKELLKKQEPVMPVLSRIGNYAAINDYTCTVCGTDLYHHQKYCDKCGSEVKWDE